MKYILVNPLSNNSRGQEALDKVLELVKEESEVLKVTQINLKDFVNYKYQFSRFCFKIKF